MTASFQSKSVSLALLSAALLLAAPLAAQQAGADDAAADGKSAAPAKTAKAAKSSGDSQDKAAPAKSNADVHIKPGSDYPHWEWFLGYSYLNGRVGSGIKSYNANGGSTNIEYNVNHWFGLVADFGGYHTGHIDDLSVDGNQASFLFGPRLNYRFGQSWRDGLFGQVLIGGAHVNANVPDVVSGMTPTNSKSSFAMAMGAGLDFGITKHVAIRPAQFEYFLTDYDFPNGYKPQNDFRYSAGIVFRWGAKPIAVNRPPTVSCSSDVTSIMEGSNDTIPIRANGSDPDGDTLTYTWTATGGRVEATGNVARWNPSGAAPGSYTITARVDDGHGGNASCSVTVRVEPRPAPRPPTLSCSASPSTVMPGERVNITGTGASPEGFPLEYSWRSNGGQISGSGSQVQLDTSGLAPGGYRVTGRVTDGHGGAADCVADLSVAAPPAKPQASKLGECLFKKLDSARVDNICSRTLDDVVVRMQNDPKSTLVITGFQDPAKEKNKKLAEERANNAKKYITDKKHGIDPGRVSTRTEAGVAGAGESNRRVELVLVPEGASY